LVVPALAVAVETNPAVGGMIRSALSAGMPSADGLERIARAVPYPSVALADTAALVIGHLVEISVSDKARHAYWLVSLSIRLSGLGRREQALAAIEEAVTIRRQLARDRPGAFLPDLATSLNTLANVLTAMKREPAAVAARLEATKLSERSDHP
jgi:hypothetical protein